MTDKITLSLNGKEVIEISFNYDPITSCYRVISGKTSYAFTDRYEALKFYHQIIGELFVENHYTLERK
jgi:hypothetical protein